MTFNSLARFELNCTSHGDPAPTIKMTLPDGRTVITPPESDLAKLDPLSPQIVSRRGPVTCEARNDKGYDMHMEELPRAGTNDPRKFTFVHLCFRH